ncbi:HD-GYP domain-containing protein [Litchfieldia salsa]
MEKGYMAMVLLSSLLIMLPIEYLKFTRDLRPISDIFHNENHSISTIQTVFNYIHRYPIITFKRIMGPHLLGLSIPASIMCYIFIKIELLIIPFQYIFLAMIGAILVAGMHGIIELFLTIKAIQPLLKYLEEYSIKKFNHGISLEGQMVLSIKKKFQLSFLYITAFPILLFSLATQVRLNVISLSGVHYWNWANFIIILALTFAFFGAKLLYSDLNQPITQLQNSMKKVQEGNLSKTDDIYSDEFSGLVNGFNHMVDAIKLRDLKNQQMFESFLESLSTALDARDPYTAGHSVRVAGYSFEIGKRAGLSNEELSLLKKSALIHDIGKIGVSDSILLKDGKLDDIEFAAIQKHPEIGAKILTQVQEFSELDPLIEGVLYHHERFDGKGYPRGLKGLDIPLYGRIIAVADAYDAMTSDRPYRKGMDKEKALHIISNGSGTQWDAELAQLFIEFMAVGSDKAESV